MALEVKCGAASILIVLLSAMLILSSSICPVAEAQNVTAFSPDDKFNIEDLNGSIRFAVNGSYSKATLDNGAWVFENLTLYNPAGLQYFDLNFSQNIKNLKIAAKDCEITIWAVVTLNYSEFPMSMLGYSIEGEGEQTVNLGLNLSRPSDASEWSVVDATNVFISPGRGWILMPDDTLLINYPTSNVTIMHFNFLDSVDTSTGFFLQHSVAILTAIILVVVVAVASVISYRQRRHALRG